MFVGHYGVALATKRLAPRASLGLLFVAAQLVDLLWPLLLFAGVERVRIVRSDNPFLRLDFEWYPWTHSLVSCAAWAVLFGVIYAAWRKDRQAAWVMAALVMSHWVLDWVSHVPDLPLYPGGPKLGLGLWRSVAGTMVVEALIFAFGVGIYARDTTATDRTGRFAFWGLVAFLILLYFANAFSAPPPSVTAVAWGSLAAVILPLLAWWADRHRRSIVTPTGAVPKVAAGNLT